MRPRVHMHSATHVRMHTCSTHADTCTHTYSLSAHIHSPMCSYLTHAHTCTNMQHMGANTSVCTDAHTHAYAIGPLYPWVGFTPGFDQQQIEIFRKKETPESAKKQNLNLPPCSLVYAEPMRRKGCAGTSCWCLCADVSYVPVPHHLV